MKKKLVLFLALALVVALTASVFVACNKEVNIGLNKTTLSLTVGDEETLTAEAEGVEWSSSDVAVVTVVDGKVTAVGAGVATITATVGDSFATCTVVVTAAPVPHVCGHKCPTCNKCLDASCTDAVCADKCSGHNEEPAGLTPAQLDKLIAVVYRENKDLVPSTAELNFNVLAKSVADFEGTEISADVKWTVDSALVTIASTPNAMGYLAVTIPARDSLSEDLVFTLTATLIDANGEPILNESGAPYTQTFTSKVKMVRNSDPDAILRFDNSGKTKTEEGQYTDLDGVVQKGDVKVTWTEDGIVLVNDINESTTACSTYTNPTRFYVGSTISVSYTSKIKAIRITVDTKESYGKVYCEGFDNMKVDGATIERQEDIVIISFAEAVDTFVSAKLPSQIRVYKVEVFTSYVPTFEDSKNEAIVASIADALKAGDKLTDNSMTDDEYKLTGIWTLGTKASDADYGNGWLTDATDSSVKIYVYGLYDSTGKVGYGKMGDKKPADGSTITVTCKIKKHKDVIELIDSKVEGLVVEVVEEPTGMTEAEILAAIANLAEGATLDGAPHTLTGIIKSIDYVYSAQYDNITVTIEVGADKVAIKCYRMVGGAALKVGDTITVTGTIVNYQGTVEFDAKCTYVLASSGSEDPTPDYEPTQPAIVVTPEKLGLTGQYADGVDKVIGSGTFAYDQLYFSDAGIQMRDKTADGKKISALWNSAAFGKKIEAVVINIVGEKLTKDMSNALRIEFGTDNTFGAESVVLNLVAGKTSYVVVPEGDYTFVRIVHTAGKPTVYVDSVAIHYEGAVDGKVPGPNAATEAEILVALATLEAGATLPDGPYVLQGKIVSVDQAYDSTFKNVTVTIEVGDDKIAIQCFRLKGGAELKVGDVIKVTGELMNYATEEKPEGSLQFAQGSAYEMVQAGEPVEVEPVEATIAEVLAACADLADGSTTTEIYKVVGILGAITNTTYGNGTLIDATDSTVILTIYGMYSADGSKKYGEIGADAPKQGDTVTLLGAIKNYKGTIQIINAKIIEVVPGEGGDEETPNDEPEGLFKFSEQGYTDATAITEVKVSEDVTITFAKGTNSNAPKYYDKGEAIRIYAGNTMTVTAAEGKTIKSITLVFSSGEGTNEITVNVGKFAEGVWTGEAQSVTFTIDGTTGHRRIAAIVVVVE